MRRGLAGTTRRTFSWKGHGARVRFSWLAALLLLVCAPPAPALNPRKPFDDYGMTLWSIDQGLPQVTVLSIAQGPKGYMWIGTEAALARFDGVHFRSFVPDNTPALPGAWIQALYNDGHGNLWIGTYKGVARYHDGRFSRIAAPNGTSPFVRDITAGPRGDIVVATRSGLFTVHDGRLVRDPALGHTRTEALLAWHGALWIGGVGKVWERTARGSTVLRAPAGPKTIINSLAGYEGAVWAATSRGLYRYADGHWVVFSHRHGLDKRPIHTLFVDSSGNLWASMGAGVARIYRGRLGQFVGKDNPDSIPDVMAMTEDREHDLWMGSYSKGVAKLWNGHGRWLSRSDGLDEELVWSVARAPQGGWWVGTRRGVERFEHGRFHLAVPPTALPNPEAYTLLVDGPRLWIGTRSGLAVFENGHVHIPPGMAPLGNTQISGIVRGPGGDLWFATNLGLFRRHAGHLTHLKARGRDSPLQCRQILFTRNGDLLVGTQVGLYERAGNELVPVAGHGLPGGLDVTALANPAPGVIVVGTLSGDRLLVSERGQWHAVTGSQGLPSSAPFFMTRDGKGWFWVAGIRGLYRFRFRALLAAARDGSEKLDPQYLLSERGNWRGSQKGYCCNGAGNAKGLLWDHRLWLPTRGGVAVVDTRDIHFNKVPPTVLIQAIRINDQWEHLPLPGTLRLPAAARNLAFRFTALSFQRPRSVRLWYRLKGYNEHWHALDDPTRRVAAYTNLPSGHYVFQVRAQNDVGVPSSRDAAFAFSIAPHFYQTWWFWALVGVVGIVLIFVGYRFQLRHLRAQRGRLEKLVETRTSELREVNERLEEASRTDPLTGLNNRRYLGMQLPSDLVWFRRQLQKGEDGEKAMVFALIDLDNFKRINDSLGHDAGDELLRQFADRLQDTVRAGDYCVRWGGEEFLIVLRPLPRDEVVKVVARIQKTISRSFSLGQEKSLSLTCSIGAIEHPFVDNDPDAVPWETLVSLADLALYAVKSSGRNGWAILRPGPAFDAAQTVSHARDDFRAALGRGELEMVDSSTA